MKISSTNTRGQEQKDLVNNSISKFFSKGETDMDIKVILFSLFLALALMPVAASAEPKVSIDTHCIAEVSSTDIECFMENEGKRVAIMVKLSIVGYQTRSDSIIDPILPGYFSNNYITMLPGESTHVHIDFNDAGFVCADDVSATNNSESSTRVMLLVEGWNVNDDMVPVSCSVNSEIM